MQRIFHSNYISYGTLFQKYDSKQLHRKASFKEPEGSVKDDKSFRALLKTSTASFQSCRALFATPSFLKACTIKGMFGVH